MNPDAAPTPLVTVVIPAFNCEGFVGEAIASVLAQDYPHLEVLVIDDGSTDATAQVAAGFGSRVRVLSQPNRGCAAARNRGLAHSGGDFVAFLDADDVWAPHKLGYQMRGLQESGLTMAYSRFLEWRPGPDGRYEPSYEMFARRDRKQLSASAVVTGDTYPYLLLDSIVWTSTVLVAKAELTRSGFFDETLALGEDYDLWLRLSRNIPMLGQEEPTALYRQHPGSITQRVNDVHYEYLVLNRALEKWGVRTIPGELNMDRLLRQRLARCMFSHGYNHSKAGNARVAAACYWKSLRHSGFRLRTAILFVLASVKCIFWPGGVAKAAD